MKIITTFICICAALIPEALLYGLFHLLNPNSEIGKIILGLGLSYLGIGVIIFWTAVIFIVWLVLMFDKN